MNQERKNMKTQLSMSKSSRKLMEAPNVILCRMVSPEKLAVELRRIDVFEPLL